MRRLGAWLIASGLLVAAAVFCAAVPAGAARAGWQVEAGVGQGADEEHRLTRLLSPTGDELLVTGLPLHPGDRFLAPDNRLYRVESVRDGVARTALVGPVDVGSPRLPLTLGPWQTDWLPAAGSWSASRVGPGGRLLAVYHTHSDESYLPTSGRTNEPWNGDIFQVGRMMSLLWRGAGLSVLHSYNRHDPHDGMAYLRSRRTALRLLRNGSTALIDVHRDTPPPEVYRRVVAGHRLASVLLVVGRQNPTLSANEAFAFAIKGYADRAYPGLIRGVLYATGDYNQDLHPRAILAEVGSTYNSLEEALAGARFFAGVVPAVLFGVRVDPRRMPEEPQQEYARRAAPSGWRGVAILLVLVVAGGSLFVLVNEDAYEAAEVLRQRLVGFIVRWVRPPGRRVGPR